MKKHTKKIALIAAALVTAMSFTSLTACGGGGSEPAANVVDEDKSANRLQLNSAEDRAALLIAMRDKEVIRCSDKLYGHKVPYSGIEAFVNTLKYKAKNNLFTYELAERYKELNLDSRTDFEKDFFEIFPALMCEGWSFDSAHLKGFDINADTFGKAWMIGYEDENISKKLPKNARAIVLETTGYWGASAPGEVSYIYYLVFENEDGTLDCNLNFLENKTRLTVVTGIDPSTDSGKCKNSSSSMGTATAFTKQVAAIEKEYTGTKYTGISEKEVNELIASNQDFNELLKLFVDTEFFDYDPYSDTFNLTEEKEKEETIKNSGPEIGMTKDEVTGGVWGEPDRKNIDEYEWGTHEQWVYDGRGYVYFEDGIVTGIQHRD